MWNTAAPAAAVAALRRPSELARRVHSPWYMQGARHESVRVADVMRRHFVTAAPEEPLPEVRQTMRLARLRHLIVVRGDRVVGLLSYRVLLESLLEEPGGHDGEQVHVAMIPCPDCVTPETPIADAADRLCRYGFGCLPVVADDDDGEPRIIGLVTEADLLRAAFGR